MEDLITLDDLQSFPGAPFPSDVVSAVGEAIREEAGWHIAPTITETLTLNTYSAPTIVLPSLKVTDVDFVRDASSGAELSGYHVMSRTGNILFPRRRALPPVV